MKKTAFIHIFLLLLSSNVISQNLDYDIQSCFNENETVQAALHQSLMSSGELNFLNSILEIPLTEADVANLRPLSPDNDIDVALCNYMQTTYTDMKWNNIGNRFYVYHYRANDFYFEVLVWIPKSPDNPDFILVENLYFIVNIQDFDVESGFQSSGISYGLKYHPGMVLPESGN